jgi:hypothetical protein
LPQHAQCGEQQENPHWLPDDEASARHGPSQPRETPSSRGRSWLSAPSGLTAPPSA